MRFLSETERSDLGKTLSANYGLREKLIMHHVPSHHSRKSQKLSKVDSIAIC